MEQSETHRAAAARELREETGLNADIGPELWQRSFDMDLGQGPVHQVERAYLLTGGRLPTPREKELAVRFLGKQPLREFALAVFNLNAFLYVD